MDRGKGRGERAIKPYTEFLAIGERRTAEGAINNASTATGYLTSKSLPNERIKPRSVEGRIGGMGCYGCNISFY